MTPETMEKTVGPGRDPRSTRPRLWQRRAPTGWAIALAAVCLASSALVAWYFTQPRRLVISFAPPAAPTHPRAALPTLQPAAAVAAAAATVAASPTPSVTPTRPAEKTATPAVDGLTDVRKLWQTAVSGRSQQAAQAALAALDRAAAGPDQAGPAARLRSQIEYTQAALDGTVYLDDARTQRWQLRATDGTTLTYPIDMSIVGSVLYLIDSGTLYRGELPGEASGGLLTVTAVLTPAQRIDTYPVKEIVAVDAGGSDGAVFVLDKAGDVYLSVTDGKTWGLEEVAALQLTNPDPSFVNIATYGNRLYILDPARNQVWRHPADDGRTGCLPGKFPWLLRPGEPDISHGIDLAVDGGVFVLQRDGTVARFDGTAERRFSLAAADGRSHLAALEQAPMRAVAVSVPPGERTLYVADAGRRRVVALDRARGGYLGQWAAPANPDFSSLHAVAAAGGRLYMLAGGSLYAYPLPVAGERAAVMAPLTGTLPVSVTLSLSATVPLSGTLPAWQPRPEADPTLVHASDLRPTDPRLPGLLAMYHFSMPIKGARLPDRAAVYPGARRAYRYGVHEGVDMYEKDVGTQVHVGTPVYAAGDGVVVRADTSYRELSLDRMNWLLDDANARHNTPRDSLDLLGGRQVWIDHGGGVYTHYLHLSGIAEGITDTLHVKAGQLIGYAGLSGTLDGLQGNLVYCHLHFEIRTGENQEYYLGQWLTIEDARRAYERILDVGVQPQYREYGP